MSDTFTVVLTANLTFAVSVEADSEDEVIGGMTLAEARKALVEAVMAMPDQELMDLVTEADIDDVRNESQAQRDDMAIDDARDGAS